jgi:hypothetical protein
VTALYLASGGTALLLRRGHRPPRMPRDGAEGTNGGELVGRYILKRFLKWGWHSGRVVSKQHAQYTVRYDDDDQEVLTEGQVRSLLTPPDADLDALLHQAKKLGRVVTTGVPTEWPDVAGSGAGAEYAGTPVAGTPCTARRRRRRPALLLSVGAAVEARWPPAAEDFPPNWPMGSVAAAAVAPDPTWYAARVQRVAGSGATATFDLDYADGSHATGVGTMHVRPATAAGGGAATKRRPPALAPPLSTPAGPPSNEAQQQAARWQKKRRPPPKGCRAVTACRGGGGTNQAVLDAFWRYVHRRMCVRAQMYPRTLTLLPAEGGGPRSHEQRPITVPADPVSRAFPPWNRFHIA